MQKMAQKGLSKGRDSYIIDPRSSHFMPYWDLTMLLALLFTATVTPYEVAFLPEINLKHEAPNAMWLINRFIDIFFFVDICLICNTMYEQPLKQGGMWIGLRKQIMKRYMASFWFYIDVVSIFPFYLFSSFADDPVTPLSALAANGTASLEYSDGNLASLRLVKLLRMLKLARCLKASARVTPYVKEYLMGYLEMTYASLEALKLFTYLLIYTHLQACFWGLFSGFTGDAKSNKPTWVGAFRADHNANFGAEPEPWEVYMAALYWSGMTITSIGYGEMLPLNSQERLVCTILMLLSGVIWTYILSSATSIASTLDPNGVLFTTTMDQLNYFMRERELPRQMRRELRTYFEKARQVREVNDDTNLIDSMSPLLQGTVSFAANRKWLDKIWWLSSLGGQRESREFIAALAKALRLRAFIAEERPALGQLYVLRRGMCVKNWRFLGGTGKGGEVWGDDMIIDSLALMDHSQAVAITYIETFTLSRESLDQASGGFPALEATIDTAARKLRLQRALVLYVCEMRGTQPRSFCAQKYAKGYFFVDSQMSIEQKVAVLHSALIDDGSLNMRLDQGNDSQSFSRQPRSLTKLSGMLRLRGSTTPREGALAPHAAGTGPLVLQQAHLQQQQQQQQGIQAMESLAATVSALATRIEAVEMEQERRHAAVLGKLQEIGDARRVEARQRTAARARSNKGLTAPPPVPKVVDGASGGASALDATDEPAPRSVDMMKSSPPPVHGAGGGTPQADSAGGGGAACSSQLDA